MPKKRSKNAVKIAYSESDSEYDDEIQTYHKQKDKILLDDEYDVSDNSEEEEVYRLEESDSEDEEIAQMQQQLRQIKRNKIKTKLESDLEDEGEDEALPDSRAWGSKKSWFMGGDVRDNKIILSGSEDEAGNAALEEKEMREIEKRRLARMSNEDYLPPSLMMTFQESKGKKKKKSQKEETDGFESKRAEERVKEMHPECIPLFTDFGLKMKELQERIIPLMGLVKSRQIDGIGAKFIQMKFHIISNYLICGGFYKYYMAKKTPRIHHHPVMQRLLELQQFYNRLVPLEKRVKADLDSILEDLRMGRDVGQVVCTVAGQQPTAADTTARKTVRKALQQAGPAAKKRKVQFSEESGLGEDDDEMGDEEEQPGDDDEDADNEQELGRRAITYEMEKNKGLVAHRKKELKNPRVKHRQKYRRALIRRKGQVRDYKPPKMAYSGEMTGIRAGIIRSRKLK